jgi:hypothetical protein
MLRSRIKHVFATPSRGSFLTCSGKINDLKLGRNIYKYTMDYKQIAIFFIYIVRAPA